MATITVTRDDLDKVSEADETIIFLIDGVYYEIDVSADNAKKFRDANAKYVKVGRVVSSKDAARRIAVIANGTAEVGSFDPAAVRAWAQSQGRPVSDKGRVPQQLVVEYQLATAGATS